MEHQATLLGHADRGTFELWEITKQGDNLWQNAAQATFATFYGGDTNEAPTVSNVDGTYSFKVPKSDGDSHSWRGTLDFNLGIPVTGWGCGAKFTITSTKPLHSVALLLIDYSTGNTAASWGESFIPAGTYTFVTPLMTDLWGSVLLPKIVMAGAEDDAEVSLSNIWMGEPESYLVGAEALRQTNIFTWVGYDRVFYESDMPAREDLQAGDIIMTTYDEATNPDQFVI